MLVAGIRARARSDADGWAVRAPGELITWGQLNSRVNRAVHVLLEADLGPDRRVAVFAENSIETAVAHLATIFAGASVVPVNVHLRPEEAAYILANCGARLVFAGPGTASVAREAASEGARVLAWRAPDNVGVESFEVALAAASPVEPPDDLPPLEGLLYTSGTSGRPKGVRLPGSMFAGGKTMTEHVANLASTSRYAGRGPHLVVGPMYHTGPLAGLRTLATGTPVVIAGHFDAESVLSAIDTHQVATSLMVPTHFTRLLALPPETRRRYDVSSISLITHTGAPCPVAVKRAMIDWFGPVFIDAYGSTETGTVALIDSAEWEKRPGSVGRAAPGYAITIRDEQGHLLAAGQEGLVCVRTIDGSGPSYFDDPDKTQASYIVPGEFVIGEIGFLDEAGYLFLTDRHSDIVVSGGVNVFPAEAEAVLLAHPDVADAAVIGIPDADMGERLHALVVARSGEVRPAALVTWCRERLTHFKCPRSAELVTELPRSAMGKVDKRGLRARYAEQPREHVAGEDVR
jgi:long-chain acyl-CoA synthetase